MNVLLNKREAAARIGVNPHTLVRMAKGGQFPAPVRLGDHPLAEHRFIESEVEAWIEARVVERDARAADNTPTPTKRGRGRPKGSKNKAITTEKPKPKRDQRSIARKRAKGKRVPGVRRDELYAKGVLIARPGKVFRRAPKRED